MADGSSDGAAVVVLDNINTRARRRRRAHARGVYPESRVFLFIFFFYGLFSSFFCINEKSHALSLLLYLSFLLSCHYFTSLPRRFRPFLDMSSSFSVFLTTFLFPSFSTLFRLFSLSLSLLLSLCLFSPLSDSYSLSTSLSL